MPQAKIGLSLLLVLYVTTNAHAQQKSGLELKGSGSTLSFELGSPDVVTDRAAFSVPSLDTVTEQQITETDLTNPPPLNSGELVRQRFPNGKVQIERWVIESAKGDLVNHGSYIQFNIKGEVVAKGNFVLGARDGEWTQQLSAEDAQRLSGSSSLPGFRPPFASKANFNRGQLDGDWTCVDAQGNPVFVWAFQAGQRQGTSTYFNVQGEVVQSIHYVNNMADGPAKIVMKPGQAAEDITFENGRMLRRIENFYPPTQGKERALRSQDWFLVATPYNLLSHDWAENLVEYQTYDKQDRIRHGRSVTYYPNGQTESEGQYARGKRLGTFVWWYPNGQQKTVGEYQEDSEEGEWRWWHENGMREASGRYVQGQMVDEWSVWDSGGRLVKRSQLGENSRMASTDSAVVR